MRRLLQPKTALVHHWLVTRRGGERVLEALMELFPDADLFTLVCDRASLLPAYRNRRIRTSLLQHLPRAAQWYRFYLPLFPAATRRLDLSGYQLVITSDAATMKGVRTSPDCMHICYCYTPMRYVWSGYETYLRATGPLGQVVFPPLASWLRRWDYAAAQRVSRFIGISRNVVDRIRLYYNRESTMIFPPVDTDYFRPASPGQPSGNYFLAVSQLVPYKRIDLIVDAFNRVSLPLIVIGDGHEKSKLERRAQSNIRFLGAQPDAVVLRAMQGCRALVFAGEEDFGIVMAEAQACGKPVIAFDRGGAREIVVDGITGVMFSEQSVKSLLGAIAQFEPVRFDPEIIRNSTLRFSRQRFLKEFSSFVEGALDGSLGSSKVLDNSPESADCVPKVSRVQETPSQYRTQKFTRSHFDSG
jgi:glycosyltransferase involved in cell wall biosynthesis